MLAAMAVPPDSQDQLRRIEARLVGLRKNADGPYVSHTFVDEMNFALNDLEAMGIPTNEFRPSDSTTVERRGVEQRLMIDGPYLRAKLDTAIQYLSGKRA
jgi:hypothetical protein